MLNKSIPMRIGILSVSLLLFVINCFAQDTTNIYPSHWWTGMKNTKLQLMIHSNEDLPSEVSLQYPGVKVMKKFQPVNKHYYFIDLVISSAAKPGKIPIRFKDREPLQFELKKRSNQNGKSRITGVTSEDLIYLIMPDRFSNGDSTNDRIEGMRDQTLNRNEIFHRHGGDLKGIENHLDYLQNLGVTALWLNPVIENDMPERSEHGYAFTNHYKIERRLGGEEAYHSLINNLHNRKMKIVQDAVYNHIGTQHFLFRDLPDSTWFHFWPTYTNTTYKDQALMDPYASESDRKRMSDGWFVPQMPDLNQQNPYVDKFLIQHAIWSTEEYGLDGWRIDTYAYNDLEFMNRCNKALLDEFPKLHMFGETWVHGIPNQSFFARNIYSAPFKSNLPGVTDFQLNLYGIVPALTQNFGWTEGVNRLYLTATNDFVYRNPMKNVIFLDNHDMSRFYSIIGEDVKKLKMGLAWLLTFRGIPQLYYGTEVGMKNFSNPDGLVRLDFPGGWPGDASNKFEASGRTEIENEIFNWVKTIANFRKNSSAIKTGKMMQYVPEEGVFVYFRYDDKQTVMCVMNQNDKPATINLSRFNERIKDFTKALDVATGTEFPLDSTLTVGEKYLLTMELRK
jgi:glycosidase